MYNFFYYSGVAVWAILGVIGLWVVVNAVGEFATPVEHYKPNPRV